MSMYKLIKSNKILLVLLFLFIVIIFQILSNKKFESLNVKVNSPEQKICLDKAAIVFNKLNNSNVKLDYSFSKNNFVLEGMLGLGYQYISYKNNNCYALVQNYNPQINEYRYSIMNIDTEVLETVILDHDLGDSSLLGSQYKEEFIKKYNLLFSDKMMLK